MLLIKILFLLHSVALANTEAHEPVKMEERPARTSSRDVKVPKALVQQLEADYHAYLKKNQFPDKDNIQRHLLNLSVELTQKHKAALNDDVRVIAPTGGGVIDLSDFVTTARGAFKSKIVVHTEDGGEPEGLRLFYISHAKERRIDGEDFGAGCNKYMEISSYYNSRGNQDGFELYTANQRYLSVIGGAFVAVSFSREALSVGTLSFTDSRYPGILCE